MSIKPMTWALYEAPVTDPTQLLVLWAMADRANDDGSACWASQQWIAERARCSVRTVRRHLAALEDAGLIRRGDQQLVAHFRADHRPVVWDIVMGAAGQNDRPVNVTEGPPVTEPQVTGGQNRRTPVADNTSFTPYGSEHVLDTSTRANAKTTGQGTRLPDSYEPSPELIQWCGEKGYDVDWEDHEAFVDYWRSQPGTRGRKTDWDATWRNWMRRAAADKKRSSRPTGRPQGQMPTERAAEVARIAAELQARHDAQTQGELL